MLKNNSKQARTGFTLIEVVLALGVFLISIVALIGLLGPMLQSIDEIEKIDEITSVVNTVGAYLQGSPDIANDGETKFDTIFKAVALDHHATLFVFRKYNDAESTSDELVIEQEIGFWNEVAGDLITDSDIEVAGRPIVAGPIYRVVLSVSSVTPDSLRDYVETTGVYQLRNGVATPEAYPEGYLAMEARLYAEDWSEAFEPGSLPSDGGERIDYTLENLLLFEPDFTFNTAIVR